MLMFVAPSPEAAKARLNAADGGAERRAAAAEAAATAEAALVEAGLALAGARQGRPLVHISSQSDPFLSLNPLTHLAYLAKVAYVEPKRVQV
jgi:hypothetical protein